MGAACRGATAGVTPPGLVFTTRGGWLGWAGAAGDTVPLGIACVRGVAAGLGAPGAAPCFGAAPVPVGVLLSLRVSAGAWPPLFCAFSSAVRVFSRWFR
jgi:hypothetical protein